MGLRGDERSRTGSGGGGYSGKPSGSLDWPIPGASLVGGVGWRVHPVYGYRSCHTGPDIRGSSGTPIHAPAAGRDDYANLDVKGKVVLVLRGEPETGDWKDHRATVARTLAAAKAGAAGFLLVDSPVISTNVGISRDLPEAMVSEAFADRLLAGKKLTVAELKKVLSKGGLASFPTGRKVRLAVKTRPWRDATTHNVVAVLPGTDPALKGEYVLVGAHLDHIGDWPRLNPGADDNASGSAALLEVARAVASMKERPRRSIVFTWFAA